MVDWHACSGFDVGEVLEEANGTFLRTVEIEDVLDWDEGQREETWVDMSSLAAMFRVSSLYSGMIGGGWWNANQVKIRTRPGSCHGLLTPQSLGDLFPPPSITAG